MKSEKGITLTSLIVYIISMTIIVSIIAVITTYFYRNTKNLGGDINQVAEYTKFNSYFTDEINKENIKILECEENYIAFDDGVQYTFVNENKGIYYNRVKICKGVTNCKFSSTIENGKETVNVEITIDDKTYNNKYTLKK